MGYWNRSGKGEENQKLNINNINAQVLNTVITLYNYLRKASSLFELVYHNRVNFK